MRDTMHNPSRRGFALVLLILLLANCAGRKSSGVIYHDENVDFSLFQTIAVLPFVNLSPASNAAERTRDVFMTMLQATGALYVLPPGEVERGIKRSSIGDSQEPTPEEVVKLARIVEADAVITGIVREYGEVRSGSATANVISLSLQLSFRFLETVRSEDDSESTIISPRLRWNIGRGSFLDVAYEKTTNKFPPRQSDTETWFADLRFAF